MIFEDLVMNDAEDKEMLDDFGGLENVLFRDIDEIHSQREYSMHCLKTEAIHDHNPTQIKVEYVQKHEIFSSPIPESDPLIKNEIFTDSSDVALRLNNQLIELLLTTRKQVATLLEECKRKREEIGKKLAKNAGMPYFKDENFFAAPPNEDTKLKKARGELQIVHLRRAPHWTEEDKELLLKSVHREVVDGMGCLPENEKIRKTKMQKPNYSKLPDNVVLEIGELGTREFDWMKIAETDFQNKHSPEKCRVVWNIYAHPAINKLSWTRRELRNLEKCVKHYKNEDWDEIARKLGTHRSGYQCFVKYNSMKKDRQNDKPWTKQEDQRLTQLANKFKIGDFINWDEIVRYMETRSKNQIYFRWMYNLSPHLKKGRFTMKEDELFEDAVEKYGLNFEKISALVLPSRTPSQLSYHYGVLKLNEVRNLDKMDIEIIHHFQNDNVPMMRVDHKKFYTPSELKSATRKVYDILSFLSANLTIPNDLDEYDCFDEKDKQLLRSLKNLPQDAIDGTISRKIEETRLRMFNNRGNESGNRFVPPLPFADDPRKNKSHYVTSYNYPYREIKLFQALPSEPNYSLSNTEISSADVSFCTYKYREFYMENFPSIKPSHWTLLGYQGLEKVRKLMTNPKQTKQNNDSRKMSKMSQRALITLRTRLVQLFQFPVVMSKIVSPEPVEDRDPHFLVEQICISSVSH